jgi:hypothetical protein
LKKSWHPNLFKNQERVWKEEKAALEERKLIDKLRREREEEAAVEELQKLQAESGGKVVQRRVEWMYSGPSNDAGITEEREGYLLGKRRIDNLLKSNETQSLQKGAAVGTGAIGEPGANINNARDTQKKVLQDPLLMIQKQKMEMQLKAMKDAQKEAKYAEKRQKEKEREKKHRHRDRERSRDREHKHRSRHNRSRSPHRSEDRGHHREHHSHGRRSRSRSRSPYHKHSSRRDRTRSPPRREDRRDFRDRDRNRDHDRDRNNYRRRDRSPPRNQVDDSEARQSAADRLASMQAEAASLEEQRAERVRQQEIKDAEEEAKHKQNMDGGRRFISSVRGQASNLDLGDAIARGRPNLRADLDT